jgi:hypothetical protein
VSQLIIPASLLTWLAFGLHATKGQSLIAGAFVATYLVAIGIAGLWLVLPWWLPFAYGAVVVWTVAHQYRRHDDRPRIGIVWRRVVSVSIGALAALSVGIIAVALAGRWPRLEPIDLACPLGSGTYLVVNGGGQVPINAHVSTLEGARCTRYADRVTVLTLSGSTASVFVSRGCFRPIRRRT